ncbi:hypothetical protein HPB50_027599 [Hyalomma asiaticum]|uniref:Uncharacterized protein n=1 Tax=Hyalomma asiaticum TaxID=266040 RepID=A0ACB7T6C2_HYAAI|nr:hypothetical protein HPB50_027599 [Hyalomma asiaticum]
MDGEDSVAPRRRALSFRRPAVVAAHGSSVIPPAPLSPRLRAVRHKAIGLIRRTLGSLSNSSTPVGSCESLPDAVFASSNHNNNNNKESQFPWGSPPSRPGTPTLAELLSAVSSMPPSPTPHVGFLPRVHFELEASTRKFRRSTSQAIAPPADRVGALVRNREADKLREETKVDFVAFVL